MISVNHNLLAANTANNLTAHYGRLATSTQRLSSGLRVNSAADDAAGLAIREMMRADIAALHQGVRNANDAISMIQTFDGALGIIDEKLIRMKELAEQAATGTYDSTQRLMIDSEFQAMGAEINRIARATDFNGIKLLDGVGLDDADVTGADGAKARAIIPGNPNDPNAPEYNVEATTTKMIAMWPGETAAQVGSWDIGGIREPDKLPASVNITITNNNVLMLGDQLVMVTPKNIGINVPQGSILDIKYDPDAGWNINGYAEGVHATPGGNVEVSSKVQRVNGQLQTVGFEFSDPNTGIGITTTLYDTNGAASSIETPEAAHWTAPTPPSFSSNMGTVTASFKDSNGNDDPNKISLEIDLGNNNIVKGTFDISNGEDRALDSVSFRLTSQEIKVNPGTDPNNPGGNGGTGANGGANGTGGLPDLFTDKVKIHFGTGNDSAEDYYYINKRDATLKGLGLEDVDIQTQDNAQGALVQIDDAIEAKDKIRAEYGTMQNRLENTAANLKIQAENLQAAEARISDMDVAQEMMNFVRNQILTQSATAMLAQANSLPQMVMSLVR